MRPGIDIKPLWSIKIYVLERIFPKNTYKMNNQIFCEIDIFYFKNAIFNA